MKQACAHGRTIRIEARGEGALVVFFAEEREFPYETWWCVDCGALSLSWGVKWLLPGTRDEATSKGEQRGCSS